MEAFGSSAVDGAESVEIIEHDFGVFFAVIGSVVGFVTLFAGFAPIFFEVGGGWLVVVVVDEVGEDGVEGFSFVGKGNVMSTASAFSCATIGEEHDSDEMWEKGCDNGLC